MTAVRVVLVAGTGVALLLALIGATMEVAQHRRHTMPFKSKAQARFMFAKHPTIARRWAHKTKSIKRLPARKRRK